jgi:phosphoribosyl 1,2-cyclic phosphodiesterase
MTFAAKFWGVRGSVPSPLTPAQVTAKVRKAFARWQDEGLSPAELPFSDISTYGGNTTCVEINAGDQQYILDLGTGVRELGKAQMAEVLKTKRLSGVILQSHVHWDHIQGLPFFAPLYLPRRQFQCNYQFFGGKSWDSQLDLVYRGQMSPPQFPVNLAELEATAMRMSFDTIFDGWTQTFSPNTGEEVIAHKKELRELERQSLPTEEVREAWLKKRLDAASEVLARKLNHPQETFGYRIQYEGKSIAFTTDHEPYAAGIPKPLLELVQDVDLWVTDCQYSHDEYIGTKGPQRMGWGHSYPEYIAAVAREAKPKKIATTHHDPDADDLRIEVIARQVADLSKIDTVPAYEGLSIEV